MISTAAFLSLVVWVIVIGLVFYLLWWLVGYIGLPEPFNKVVRIILAVAAVIFLINVLLGLAGHPLLR
jgi:uncharacterized membrane protein